MVKGAARRAVIVRPADTQHFEQAIFIVAESEKGGMTEGQLLQEAQRVTGCYAPAQKLQRIKVPAAFAAGMASTGGLWMLGTMFF